MRVYRFADVKYKGYDFEVVGDYEDGGFYESDILLDGNSVLDLTMDAGWDDAIVQRAEAILQEIDGGCGV